ncbi:NUDIX domain-containing protein [Paenibacillus xylanexedens]|uniref:NUDIX domain-containing protein n=1 Tax=Paenibacillus xylanexedens TaxID=528191 RepID=UPI000F528D02|nr:NUDIX domain-containing protein [Paenibacillus xylanexedens]RPK31370.1 hypothetical protein EDO6_01997 [Paenibacillus xylanexedens]
MAFPTHIVSAGGIVEDGTGNILLVKAHDDGWVYPGGITEVGENLIDGVIREIKEESGIDATVSHLISVVSFVLCPNSTVVATKEAMRAKKGYGIRSVDELDRVLRNETPRSGLWLDSSDLSPEETVKEIIMRLQNEALIT